MCIVGSEAVDFSLNHYSGIRHGILFSKNNIEQEDCIYTISYFCLYQLGRFMKDFHATGILLDEKNADWNKKII